MKKHIGKWLVGAFIVLFALFVLALRSVGEGPSVGFRIELGDGLRYIAARLEDEGLIRSRIAFSLYGGVSGRGSSLKPGLYQVHSDMSSSQILRAFHEGPRDIVVTIFEGETARDIDNTLSGVGIVEQGEFYRIAESLEGFLFPDTYRLSPSMSPEDVVATLLTTFEEKIDGVDSGVARLATQIRECLERGGQHVDCGMIDSADTETYNKLVVASLIEKEVPESSERKIAAGIVYRRLAIDMPIQVDATILYEVCGRTFYDCRSLQRADFKTDSRYNTYQRIGLPPTPISNPGKDAVEAAVHPQKSSYWYYLSDPETRKTIFSETLEEHNEKRALYLGL